jgi:hypothetical protein
MFRSRFTLLVVALFCACSGAAHAKDKPAKGRSPDGKWEYRVVDNAASIVKAGSTEVAVELPAGDDPSAAEPGTVESGAIMWAPDSRRFAYNYRTSLRSHTCVLYEFTGSEWKPLPEFEEKAEAVQEAVEAAMLQQIKRLGFPADSHQRRIGENWQARRWIDNSTLELLAHSAANVENEPVSGAVVFRVRCDGKGDWTIISQRKVTGAELKKLESD